jgi:hypothetical protein
MPDNDPPGKFSHRELIRARTDEGRERAKVRGRREAIRRRDHGEETLVEFGRQLQYNVSGWTISRLAQ